MTTRLIRFAVACLCIGGFSLGLIHAQQRGGAQSGPPRLGFRVAPASYQQNCGTCHGTQGTVTDGRKAPAIGELQELSPERVYAVLNGNTVAAHANLAAFNELQKRQFAEFTSGRPMNSAAGDSKTMTNKCASNATLADPSRSPGWNGWGNTTSNTRLQTDAAAGLTNQQVQGLKLKWAFGVPNATEMFSQATIASGRVFFGSDAAWLYSLDAKTGCIYWSFGADAGIRATPVIARIRNQGATEYAVYFTDVLTRVYAVDAQNGKLLWKTKAGEHPRAKSSNGVAVADGRVFAGFSSMETTTGAVATYECCSFRGHVVALDANTGKKLWTTFVIPEEPRPRGKNAQGVTLYGPSGGSVWNVPTVDPAAGRVYVGTGNAYTSPAAKGTDSVIAMDVATGKIVWQHQEVAGDAYIANCGATSRGGDNCPETLGPDYDFGGSSMILEKLADGRSILVAGSKGGFVMAFNAADGTVLWKTNVAERAPGPQGLIVFGGASDGQTAYYGLNQNGAIVTAVNLADGARKWTSAPIQGARGIAAANTAIRGVVFSHASDGTLRAHSMTDGRVLFEFATAKEFQTVNEVPARGGAFGQSGSTIAGGMLFVGSGYNGQGSGGNVMLAFGLE
ncbi:MAG TPA: PQQ-binding-like beta-propeller repeat protein [Terriglobia bacterium]|nr:PQQ-binding-like beta-propeller repeat protein [Terriglobia bacterium]